MSNFSATPNDSPTSTTLFWLLTGWRGKPETCPPCAPDELTLSAIETWATAARKALSECSPDFGDPLRVREFLCQRDAYAQNAALLQHILQNKVAEIAGTDGERQRELLAANHLLETLRLECTYDCKLLAKASDGETDSEMPADLEWTLPDSPQRWAKLFGYSTDTLKRRFKDGKIRFKRLSTKSYQIAVDDLPAVHQTKFRNGQNPPAK